MAIGTALAIGGAIKGATELGKLWFGNRQRKRGLERQRQAERIWDARPDMQVPESVMRMVDTYRDISQMSRLPGQDIIEGNVRGSTATGIEAIKDLSSGAGGLGAIAGIIGREQDVLADLGINLAEMNLQGKYGLANALGRQGEWENMVWQWNKAQPWQRRYEEAYSEGHAMEGAGVQNMWSGLTGAGNVASDMLLGRAVTKGSGEKGDQGDIDDLIKLMAVGGI